MKARIRIAFTDIDGTLLDKNRQVASATIREVDRITALGIPFILISSRMPRAMTHLQADLHIQGLPLIAYNGGLVLVNDEVILSRAIELPIVKAVARLNEGRSFSTGLYHGDEWYVAEMDHYALREEHNTRTSPYARPLAETITDWETRKLGAHKIMCMGKPGELDFVISELETAYPGALHLYRSKEDYLEIADARISKLTGIQTLLDHSYPKVKLEDCLAFGDNYNDVEMLAGVGTGVAVANARAEAKAVAQHIVATNKEDGVAEGLQLFI